MSVQRLVNKSEGRDPSLSRRSFVLGGAMLAMTGLALGGLPSSAQARLIAVPYLLPQSSAVAGGGLVPAPIAWLRLVKAVPNLNPGGYKFRPVKSTREREAELVHVQKTVNDTVRFQRETNDIWQPAAASGDCEDFAIRKLLSLTREFGWPRGALTLATCRTEVGEGHAVLLAHTDRGAYVLDNRRTKVMPWRAVHYRWWAREAPGSPFALWRAIKA